RVGVNADATWIPEDIVETALDVGDSSVGRPTGAGLVEERHLIRDLVADERQQRVELIRQVHLRRLGAARHSLPVLVDGLDDQEIVGQVHPRTAIAPAIGAPQASCAASRTSGSSGSATAMIRRGEMVSRPARASAVSVASMDA